MPARRSLLRLLRVGPLLAALALFAQTSRAKGWRLSWGDEFDGRAGAAVDPAKWTHATGGTGWGNRELEFYTDSTENALLDGRGALVITALSRRLGPDFKCWYGPCLYTSARLVTKGRFSQAYGRFEARIKLPAGQGMWPAFWLLGEDIDRRGWPACGEIDVMENIGREPAVVHGTIHGPGYSGEKGIGAPYALPSGRVADDFHVYAVEWEPNVIRWYFDDHLYETRTPADLPAGARWVYDHPFFVLLNLAVGGTWPGPPDATTTFPQTMTVDYVRIYRRPPSAGPTRGARTAGAKPAGR